MKSVLEQHLQKACEKFFPNAHMVIRLQQKKFADYSLDDLCHWAKAFDLDIVKLGDIFCETLLKVEGVQHVCVEKSCHLNIQVDAFARYGLIFHGIQDTNFLSHRPLLPQKTQNIEYALLRLQPILAHLPFEKTPVYPHTIRKEEKKILECLDELLSVTELNKFQDVSWPLNHLANNIHGYLRVITLLCEDKMRYQFQIQLLKLSDLMLRNGNFGHK